MPKFYRSVYSTVANIPASVLREESKKEGKTGKNASERKLSDYIRTIFFFPNFRSIVLTDRV